MGTYLDNAATTQMYPEVIEAMAPYLREQYGNPGSLYTLVINANMAVKKARENVAEFLNCEPEQVIFTSGGSEGNNLVFGGLRPYLEQTGKKRIITSCVEHDSILKAVEALKIKDQFYASYLPVNPDGTVCYEYLTPEFLKDAGVVSVMYANNEVDAVNPVGKIAELCHASGVPFHTDCVQAAGFQELDVHKLGCDYLTISSHKIHGPKGVGALYVKDPKNLSPIIYGGSNQEHGLRGGTENVASIVGFGEACRLSAAERMSSVANIMGMKDRFYKELCFELKKHDSRVIPHINGVGLHSPSKILNLCFAPIDGQSLVISLGTCGVYISAGSACRSAEAKPSHVLTMMGVQQSSAMCSVRISFSSFNTVDDALCAAHLMSECISLLQMRFVDSYGCP